jgi:hypothetical protein
MELLRARLQQRLPGVSGGQLTCPRCGQSQEAAPFCKWCGGSLEGGAAPPAKLPGSPRPTMSFPWFRILSTGLVLLVLVLMPVLQEMQVPQAYRASRDFLMEESRLATSLGGELQWGPLPFFFWRSVESSSELWKGSFYFLARGPKATVVVVVALEKAAAPGGAWRVIDGTYVLDTGGNRRPLSGPSKTVVPRKA